MAQPNAPATPPTPAANETKPPQNGTIPPKGETKPPVGETIQPAGETEPKKAPATQLEADLAAQFGEDWDTMSPKVKDRVIAAEMKSREADKRMQLAAKLKKDLDMTNTQVNQLIDALKKDPWKVLSNPALGLDARKMAEEYVWNQIQQERMTPEQRQAAQDRLENSQMKAEKEQAQREQQEREMNALIAQRRAYWEKTIPEAIDAAGLPKTSYTVRRFAEYIKAAAKARMPADMPAIATQIRQELVDLQSKFLLPPKAAGETDEAYEERVLTGAPSEYVKMLRKADLRKLRAKGIMPKPGPKPGATSQPAKPNNGKMLMSEWMNKREERLRSPRA
jgi:hypothetical protein